MAIGALFVVLPLALGACGVQSDDASRDEAAASEGAHAPITAVEFTVPLSKKLVQSTHTLAADVFETKWTTSLSDGALMFFRAYPSAFHLDVKQLAQDSLPGDVGMCVGDGHPANFGYLSLGPGATIYAFNDLDDSGTCKIAVDALRYFTAFRLYFEDKTKLKDSLDAYTQEATAGDSRTPVDLATHVANGKDAPRWADVKTDTLAKYTEGTAFRAMSKAELLPVDAATKDDVRKALAAASPSHGASVLDVAQRPRDGGGSGGLARYWALVDLAGQRTILELKETATPGVEFGYVAQHVELGARLPVLLSAFWSVTQGSDYFAANIGKRKFLVRDRTRKASVDPKSEHRAAQASFLGALHRGKWQTMKRDAIRDWLDDSSKVLAKRWQDFYDAEKSHP